MGEKKTTAVPKFGAFNGVFLPTFLSIIGVILFLRLGYIVGSAGVLQTFIIILLAVSTTLCTGLSLSSITTNIRIGSGGAYSIISKSLGLEVGGSVGIPLFLAQVLSIALYIFGFVEGWAYIFPSHPVILVLLITLLVLFLMTFLSTRLAVKAQIFVFGLLIATFISLFLGGNWFGSMVSAPQPVPLVSGSFWLLFALFFPAVTGLMVGIGLSGELKDPKRQIPKGIIWAIVSTAAIYLLTAFWLSKSATSGQLISDTKIMISLAYYGPLVLAGLLASAFSSALTTSVAAPRLLQAMGDHSILPGSRFFSKKSRVGIPHNAILFSFVFILVIIFIGNLNAVAPVLTIFFLITYAMINIVVFIEQSLGLVSFRPTLKLNKFVPLYGALSSIVFMFLINVIAGMAATIFLFLSYLFLVKRRIKAREGDIRSGLFLALSEWAARKVLTLPEDTKHTWKPSVLVPVVSTSTLLGNFPLIKAIIFPHGTMTILGLDLSNAASAPEEITISKKQMKKEMQEIPGLAMKFGEEGIFTSSSVVSVENYARGVCISLEAIEGQIFHPNILFLSFKPKNIAKTFLAKIFDVARKNHVGIVLVDRDKETGLGSEEDIHVWLPPTIINKEMYKDKDYDLAMLIGYRLSRNWAGNLNLWICVDKDSEAEARRYLKKLVYEARFPSTTKINVSTKTFRQTLRKAPRGDIHIVPFNMRTSARTIQSISNAEKKTFLFIADSTTEDVLA
ncbi:MAG: amino acid permease [archaeon]